MSKSISFGVSPRLGASSIEEDSVREAIKEGKLPGKWGLIQAVISVWNIPKQKRSLVAYGQAALDTVGQYLKYKDSLKVLFEQSSPTITYMKEQGYVKLYNRWSQFRQFVIATLSDLDFKDQRVKGNNGEFDEYIIKWFDIGDGKRAAFLEEITGSGKAKKLGGPAAWWKGPYVQLEDVEYFKCFLRKVVWDKINSDRIRISFERKTALGSNSGMYMGKQLTLSPDNSEIDFVSGSDEWNNIDAMRDRCEKFLKTGSNRTILFHGPPGTGKTTFAMSIAKSMGTRTLILDNSALPHMNDTHIFNFIDVIAPGMVILNDVDRSVRGNASNLLGGLERLCTSNLEIPLVTAITVNDISKLDPAMLRPGRVSEIYKVPEPTEDSRRSILRYYLDKFGIDKPDVDIDIEEVVELTDEFSPADIKELCETMKAVGMDLALSEIRRIRNQRDFYAGDACLNFNRRVTSDSYVIDFDDDEEDI